MKVFCFSINHGQKSIKEEEKSGLIIEFSVPQGSLGQCDQSFPMLLDEVTPNTQDRIRLQ